MSTAAAWHGLPAHASARPGVSGSRARLVVIDGGRRPAEHARAARLDAMVHRVPRGLRLAVTLCAVVIAAALLLGIGVAGATTGPVGSVEVRPGQTLSEIARAEMPGMPTGEAVARIQLANNLPSSHVRAGQVIVIPGY